jgi:hypothetical protein
MSDDIWRDVPQMLTYYAAHFVQDEDLLSERPTLIPTSAKAYFG